MSFRGWLLEGIILVLAGYTVVSRSEDYGILATIFIAGALTARAVSLHIEAAVKEIKGNKA